MNTPTALLDRLDAIGRSLNHHDDALALMAYVLEQARGQGTAQALLTSTDPGLFTGEFLGQATVLAVHEGRVSRD